MMDRSAQRKISAIGSQDVCEATEEFDCRCDSHDKTFAEYIKLARNLFNRVVADLHGKNDLNRASAKRWLANEDPEWMFSIEAVSYWTHWSVDSLVKMAKENVVLPSMGVGHVGAIGQTEYRKDRRKNTCIYPGCQEKCQNEYCRKHLLIANYRKKQFEKEFGYTPPIKYLHLPKMSRRDKTPLPEVYKNMYGEYP